MSLKTPKVVFSASDRKFTAAGGDVQVPFGGIQASKKFSPPWKNMLDIV